VNETEWIGYTMFPFGIGEGPPKDCTLVCKVCKRSPVCVSACNARIYYSYGENPKIRRAAIHFGKHTHPVSRSVYRDSTEAICELIAEQVAKTPSATNLAIFLFASKDFLNSHLFHNSEGEKKMLKG